jgi:hypothetical protein
MMVGGENRAEKARLTSVLENEFPIFCLAFLGAVLPNVVESIPHKKALCTLEGFAVLISFPLTSLAAHVQSAPTEHPE